MCDPNSEFWFQLIRCIFIPFHATHQEWKSGSVLPMHFSTLMCSARYWCQTGNVWGGFWTLPYDNWAVCSTLTNHADVIWRQEVKWEAALLKSQLEYKLIIWQHKNSGSLSFTLNHSLWSGVCNSQSSHTLAMGLEGGFVSGCLWSSFLSVILSLLCGVSVRAKENFSVVFFALKKKKK